MTDEDILQELRAERQSGALALAARLEELTGGQLGQGTMVSYFARAFPDVPLRVFLEAGAWNRLTNGSLSDADFEEALAPWLTPPPTVD